MPVAGFQAPTWEGTVALLALGVPGSCPAWGGLRLLLFGFPVACPPFFFVHSWCRASVALC